MFFQSTPELVIIPSKKTADITKQPPQPDLDKQLIIQETGDNKPLILPEESDEESARRKKKKEKKRRKEKKREKERKEREDQTASDRGKDKARDEEKLNNINSPRHDIDKETKVKFTFEDIVSKAQLAKESAGLLRKSSLKESFTAFKRSDTVDSFQEEGIHDLPPASKPSQYSWSPRISMGSRGLTIDELETSDEENASPKSPSFWNVSKGAGSDSSASDHKGRRKLRRRLSDKKKKKKRSYSDSD